MNNVTHIRPRLNADDHPTWCDPKECTTDDEGQTLHVRHLETATILDAGNDGPQLHMRALHTRSDAHAATRDLKAFIRARHEYENEETTAA